MAIRIFCEAPSEGAPAGAGAENGAAQPLRPIDVRAVVAIASAKGGVGKTAVCVNLAAALASAGRKVAIVDADLNSPGILGMLGLKPLRRFSASEEIDPVSGPMGIRVVASSLLAEGEPVAFSFVDPDDEPAPARALNGVRPLELGHRATLRRLLATRFGPLDVMLVDLASGLAQLHYLAESVALTGAVMVTLPSEAAVRATRNALETLAHTELPILGLVENMVGFNCESCHAVRPLFPQGDLAGLAHSAGLPVLGRLPFDPRLADCCERGVLFVREYAEAPLARQFAAMAMAIENEIARRAGAPSASAVSSDR